MLAGMLVLSRAHGAGAQVLLQGEVRLAYAFGNNPINTTATVSSGFVDVPNLVTSVTIPAGHVADVLILFSGEIDFIGNSVYSGDAELQQIERQTP
jgi:hypothetical protein